MFTSVFLLVKEVFKQDDLGYSKLWFSDYVSLSLIREVFIFIFGVQEERVVRPR